MYKSCFQLAVIIFAKTMKSRFPLVHSCIYTFIVIMNVGYIWKLHPFNYERFNLWTNVVNTACVWIGFLGLLVNAGADPLVILILIFVGILVIVVTGVVV